MIQITKSYKEICGNMKSIDSMSDAFTDVSFIASMVALWTSKQINYTHPDIESYFHFPKQNIYHLLSE